MATIVAKLNPRDTVWNPLDPDNWIGGVVPGPNFILIRLIVLMNKGILILLNLNIMIIMLHILVIDMIPL